VCEPEPGLVALPPPVPPGAPTPLAASAPTGTAPAARPHRRAFQLAAPTGLAILGCALWLGLRAPPPAPLATASLSALPRPAARPVVEPIVPQPLPRARPPVEPVARHRRPLNRRAATAAPDSASGKGQVYLATPGVTSEVVLEGRVIAHTPCHIYLPVGRQRILLRHAALHVETPVEVMVSALGLATVKTTFELRSGGVRSSPAP
jgi:hypothetical protein